MGRALNLVLLLAVVSVVASVVLVHYTPERREEFNNALTTTTASPAANPGYAPEEPEGEWKLASDKYVFIEHTTEERGELIEGEYTGMEVDFPTYSFDKKTGILGVSPSNDMGINDTLKVVYGIVTTMGGARGYGTASRLYGVYALPYETHTEPAFRILEVDVNGTTRIEYKNTSITLNSGKEWVNVTSEITPTFSYSPSKGSVQVGKINMTTTDKIVNYGILNKSKISTLS